jgi:hypothetical protein
MRSKSYIIVLQIMRITSRKRTYSPGAFGPSVPVFEPGQNSRDYRLNPLVPVQIYIETKGPATWCGQGACGGGPLVPVCETSWDWRVSAAVEKMDVSLPRQRFRVEQRFSAAAETLAVSLSRQSFRVLYYSFNSAMHTSFKKPQTSSCIYRHRHEIKYN